MQKIEITYKEYLQYMQKLLIEVNDYMSKYGRFDYIIAVPRGGLVPATYLSHATGIPLKTDADEFSGPLGCVRKVRLLFVDDIVDTGCTYDKIKRYMQDIYFAAVVVRKTATNYSCPDFYGYEYKGLEYLVFPWEEWHK